MPWELGRCSIEPGSRHIDVRNVVWLGTSNVGHDTAFEYQYARANPQQPFSREEYTELMGLVRPKLSDRLGVSTFYRFRTIFNVGVDLV
jgi:ATP-dependent Clp protease ATP-binding subunit ClpA